MGSSTLEFIHTNFIPIDERLKNCRGVLSFFQELRTPRNKLYIRNRHARRRGIQK